MNAFLFVFLSMLMKSKNQKSSVPFILIALILIAVLIRRLRIRSLSMDSLLTFVAGFAVIFIGYLIFKVVYKKKQTKK
jgi:hypothetical protein